VRAAPAALAALSLMALALASAAVAKEKPERAGKPAHHHAVKVAEGEAKSVKAKKAKARPEKAKKAKAAEGMAANAKPEKRKATKPRGKPVADAGDDEATLETEQVHLVKPGETLSGIAVRAKVPRVLIAEANHLPKPWKVHAGQKLKLPRTRHHTVAAGETGFDISYQYGVPFSAIAVANGLSAKAVLKPGQDLLIPTILAPVSPASGDGDKGADKVEGKGADKAGDDAPAAAKSATAFAWPLDGAVRRGFTPRSSRNYHDGIDIVAAPGAAVRAADGGTVIFSGREPQSYGNLVVVQHGNGWQSAYGFLGKITVAKGDTVRKRERIGMVGHTGKATRDELHFELRKANQPVDPIDSLPARGH